MREDSIIILKELILLEQFKSSTEIEIRNLIEQIKSLVSTIKWFMTFGTATLVGFFIWYIQQIGRPLEVALVSLSMLW